MTDVSEGPSPLQKKVEIASIGLTILIVVAIHVLAFIEERPACLDENAGGSSGNAAVCPPTKPR